MEVGKNSDLIELKNELVTVVEALSVLHDFVESIFGTKYHTFVSNQAPLGGGTRESGAHENSGSVENVQSALRKLRWKHSKGSCDDDRTLSSPSSGPASRESKGDNGYSSGGTPGTSLGEEGRRDSVSSQNNQKMVSTTECRRKTIESREDESENTRRFPLTVGRPEIVAVKCEVEDTDFLDDMDPFGSEHGDFHYEGEESDLKIEDCYALPSSHQDAQNLFPEKSPVVAEHHGTPTNSSPRFIPELIPIQPDPLLQNAPPTIPIASQVGNEEPDSGSSSSENSDAEWQPTSSYTNVTPKRLKKDNSKNKRKLPPKRSLQPDRKPIISNVASNLTTAIPSARQHSPLTVPSTGYVSGGSSGAFKCDMCPASYKQEESLRSHQKYKHNPSRVQCTCHLCGKSMVDKYRLQRHLRLHTGEKPFECEYCGQSFYRKDYHTKHLQRKHGISYNAGVGAPSKILRNGGGKPVVGKPKHAISSSSPSSYTISSSSSASSSSLQSLRSGVFETPSPPPLSAGSYHRKPIVSSSLASQVTHRHSYTSTTTSPSSSSTSSVTTSSSGVSVGEMTMREHGNFVDIFSSSHSSAGVHRGGEGIDSASSASEYSYNAGGISNLMTMASLTFDDLISADL